jgi:hypothetical protein
MAGNEARQAAAAARHGQSTTPAGGNAERAMDDCFARISNSCFTGRMLIDVPEGRKQAKDIRVSDLVASRSEFDPKGPVEYKEVEEVFVRVSPILNLHVAGQVIETTPEHPSYNKMRSRNGVWQYRAEPVDTRLNHVHLERLDPSTGEVLEKLAPLLSERGSSSEYPYPVVG